MPSVPAAHRVRCLRVSRRNGCRLAGMEDLEGIGSDPWKLEVRVK